MLVLGVPASEGLLDRWIGWFLPKRQPFLVPTALAESQGLPDGRDQLTFEVRDTFWLYDPGRSAVVWLIRSQAAALP